MNFKISRVIKFLISGGAAALLEFSIFILLINLTNKELLVMSQSVSFLSGFILSFILQKIWVFESKGSVSGELVKYGLLAAINLVLSSLLIWALVDLLGVDSSLGKIIVMGMVAAWNYMIFQKIIFKSNT
jgi:putative flippase GtrA